MRLNTCAALNTWSWTHTEANPNASALRASWMIDCTSSTPQLLHKEIPICIVSFSSRGLKDLRSPTTNTLYASLSPDPRRDWSSRDQREGTLGVLRGQGGSHISADTGAKAGIIASPGGQGSASPRTRHARAGWLRGVRRDPSPWQSGVRSVVVGCRAGAEHGTDWGLRCPCPGDWRTFSRQNHYDLVEDEGRRHKTAGAAIRESPPRLGNPA